METVRSQNERFVWHRPKDEPIGPRTHALVIGTSFYEHVDGQIFKKLNLKGLDCAASSAFRFASWLKDSYRSAEAPLGSIRLLASPSELERGVLNANHKVSLFPSTAENVEEALATWQIDCQQQEGNVALLYVSGHGVLESPDQVYVLLQDAFGQLNLRNALSIAPTQIALGAGRLSASIIFVDSCQQVLPDAHWDLRGGIYLSPPRDPQPDSRTCAPIYYASSPGGSAFGEAGKGTYFCDALIKCLEVRAATQKQSDPKVWSVTTNSLHRELPSAVQELAPKQVVRPAGWGRDRDLHQLVNPPVLPLSVSVTPKEKAGFAQGTLRDYCKTEVESNIRFANSQYSARLPCGSYSLRMICDPPPRFVEQVHRIFHSPPFGGKEQIDLE
jgi:hypothetical protein